MKLSVHHVTVRHNARDHGEHVSVAARDRAHASALAIGIVRERHCLPTSISLFAEVAA